VALHKVLGLSNRPKKFLSQTKKPKLENTKEVFMQQWRKVLRSLGFVKKIEFHAQVTGQLRMVLDQTWETSGPPNTLMWPSSYIRSFLNSYIDYENTLNIKKVPVLLQKQP